MAARPTQIDSDKFTMKYVPEGYVHLSWHEGVEVEPVDARAALAALDELAGGKRPPILVDMGSLRKIDRGAREELSGTEKVDRVALIVRTALSRTVGAFFVGLGKPVKPTRVFTDEEAARKWLLDDNETAEAP